MAQGDSGAALAYLALGSNLGNPVQQLSAAIASIKRIARTVLVRQSSLYRSPAWGSPQGQPDYLNAVVAVRSTLTPSELWQATCSIEQAQGRVRTDERNAARTLDIDLLLYDNVIAHGLPLTLPHPRMHERAFVLLPLVEIAHDIVIQGQGPAAALLNALPDQAKQSCIKVSPWN